MDKLKLLRPHKSIEAATTEETIAWAAEPHPRLICCEAADVSNKS